MKIAVLEEQKRVAEKKMEDEEKTNEMVDRSTTGPAITSDEKRGKANADDILKKETDVITLNLKLLINFLFWNPTS